VNPTPQDPVQRIAELQAELERVKRREAEFRAKMVQEFLDRGERNTHLHVLREEKAALIKREQEAFADLEELTRKLEAACDRTAALEAELGRMKNSWAWRLFAPRSPLPAPASPNPSAPADGGVFTYYLHTSPFRIYRDPAFTLRGWAWPQDGRPVTAVRINLDGRLFVGRHGLDEPEVIDRHGPQPANLRPGFEIAFETPPGRHLMSLEAQLDNSEWRSIVKTSIWCEPRRP
jgi:hypothetical protein